MIMTTDMHTAKVCTMHTALVLYWHTYISLEHAALSGGSILSPSFSNFGRLNGDSPPYGILPPLNISQHVTPNAHYISIYKGWQ